MNGESWTCKNNGENGDGEQWEQLKNKVIIIWGEWKEVSEKK